MVERGIFQLEIWSGKSGERLKVVFYIDVCGKAEFFEGMGRRAVYMFILVCVYVCVCMWKIDIEG